MLRSREYCMMQLQPHNQLHSSDLCEKQRNRPGRRKVVCSGGCLLQILVKCKSVSASQQVTGLSRYRLRYHLYVTLVHRSSSYNFRCEKYGKNEPTGKSLFFLNFPLHVTRIIAEQWTRCSFLCLLECARFTSIRANSYTS